MAATQILYPQPCHTTADEARAAHVYFGFEEDFVEDNIRCIPMIVRFKLDACGIKLKLNEWSRMNAAERKVLCETRCLDIDDIMQYRACLERIVLRRTGDCATTIPVEPDPAWADTGKLPDILKNKLAEFNWWLTLQQWASLSNLHRFALLKLCRPGHENRNFPKAMKEFFLV